MILPEEYKAELRTLHDQAATFDFPEVGLGTSGSFRVPKRSRGDGAKMPGQGENGHLVL